MFILRQTIFPSKPKNPLKLDNSVVNQVIDFVNKNKGLFNLKDNSSILLIYSPEINRKRHWPYKACFNAVANILVRLHIQFDVR